MKYVLEYEKSPDNICIHIRVRLTDFDYEYWDYPTDSSYHETKPPGWALALFDITGIDSLGCERWGVEVCKGVAFDWEELLPQILSALKAFFSPDEEMIEKEPPRHPETIIDDEDLDDNGSDKDYDLAKD